MRASVLAEQSSASHEHDLDSASPGLRSSRSLALASVGPSLSPDSLSPPFGLLLGRDPEGGLPPARRRMLRGGWTGTSRRPVHGPDGRMRGRGEASSLEHRPERQMLPANDTFRTQNPSRPKCNPTPAALFDCTGACACGCMEDGVLCVYIRYLESRGCSETCGPVYLLFPETLFFQLATRLGLNEVCRYCMQSTIERDDTCVPAVPDIHTDGMPTFQHTRLVNQPAFARALSDLCDGCPDASSTRFGDRHCLAQSTPAFDVAYPTKEDTEELRAASAPPYFPLQPRAARAGHNGRILASSIPFRRARGRFVPFGRACVTVALRRRWLPLCRGRGTGTGLAVVRRIEMRRDLRCGEWVGEWVG